MGHIIDGKIKTGKTINYTQNWNFNVTELGFKLGL